MKEDHRSFKRNFRSCDKKVLKNSGLYGIRKLYLCDTSAALDVIFIIQSNLAISNSVNSKSPLFRRKIECPWIYPSPLRFPGYFEAPLFRTFFISLGTSK